jgi:hypothetical protein
MIAAIRKRNAFAVQNAELAHHRFEASAIARRRYHDFEADQDCHWPGSRHAG